MSYLYFIFDKKDNTSQIVTSILAPQEEQFVAGDFGRHAGGGAQTLK